MWREVQVQVEEGKREESAVLCVTELFVGRGAEPGGGGRGEARPGVGTRRGEEREKVWNSSRWGETEPQQQRRVREGTELP